MKIIFSLNLALTDSKQLFQETIPRMIENYIKAFQIRTINGEIYYYEIEQLNLLDTFLQANPISYIAKLSFYFNDPNMPTRNLILRQRIPLRFTPEFPTTYSSSFINIPLLSEQEEQYDFNAVYNLLNNSFNLDDRIGKYIINPFQNSQTNNDNNGILIE